MTTGPKDPHETPATTLGNGSRRLFDYKSAPGVARYDISNPDEVYRLAVVTSKAGKRRLMQVTLAEQKSIAMLAADAAPLASQARDYLHLLARKAPADEIAARLEAMAETAGIKI